MHWSHKPAKPQGVTFEAHAAWCPVEVTRCEVAAFDAETLMPQCECVPGYYLAGVRIGCFPPMKPVVFDGP